MILEEIDGDVKVVLNGKTLAIGDSIEDHQYALVAVLGKGKATFRVDPSCTIETKGVETAVEAVAPKPIPKTEITAAAKTEVVTEVLEDNNPTEA